jgi:Asp-tRNA(Asn)/Glu-tRNA(Gln) amidotransferase A subunit family amidase
LYKPISELSRLIRARQLSPVELTTHYIQRARKIDPELYAFVTFTEELAMAQARAAERELVNGKFRGPLHGIPWGAKDVLATDGIPTQWGSPIYQGQVFKYDATVVQKLREAGAILLGKLASGELASGAKWFGGTTRCPWDTSRSSGGSSAGPAAATAAGMVGFSLGTETLGSILSPSATNGVVGVRPTYGRVSRFGVMALSWSMDKVGPIGRSVEDCARILDAIAGPDPRDPSTVEAMSIGERPLAHSVKGKKIGVMRDEFNSASEPETALVYRDALKSLESLGLSVEEVQLDDYPYQDIARYTMNIEAASVFESLWKTGQIDRMLNKQRVIDWSAARMLSAVDYVKIQRLRGEICDYAAGLFKRYAALVAPTSSTPAALVDVADLPASNPIGIVSTGGTFAFGNLTGLPAVSVPCGFTPSNLPLGLQFIGAPFDEIGILRIAHAYEQANVWHQRHPNF